MCARHEIAKMDSPVDRTGIHETDDDDDDDEVVRARPRHAIDNSRIFPALNRCHPIRGRGGGGGSDKGDGMDYYRRCIAKGR